MFKKLLRIWYIFLILKFPLQINDLSLNFKSSDDHKMTVQILKTQKLSISCIKKSSKLIFETIKKASFLKWTIIITDSSLPIDPIHENPSNDATIEHLFKNFIIYWPVIFEFSSNTFQKTNCANPLHTNLFFFFWFERS